MEMMYPYAILFHAFMGGLALIAGTFAAIFKKGSPKHSKAGRFFLVFMTISVATALALTFIKPNPFLLGIGLFTGYLLASGWNWIRRISPKSKARNAKTIGALAIAAAAFMGYHAFIGKGLNVVLLVFGSIMTLFACMDILKEVHPMHHARLHGGRMGGAFIAAITAFMVVNEVLVHPMLSWFLPSVIGSPLIAVGIKKYYIKRGRE